MAMDPDVTEPSPAETPATSGPASRTWTHLARNVPGALRLAYFLTGNRELAEDLVQEAFVRVAWPVFATSACRMRSMPTCGGPS